MTGQGISGGTGHFFIGRLFCRKLELTAMKNIQTAALCMPALLLLSSCVGPAFSNEVSAGVYQISAGGSIWASSEKYQKKLHNKALKLCANGYETVAPVQYESSTTKTYINGQIMDIYGSRYKTTVKCR